MFHTNKASAKREVIFLLLFGHFFALTSMSGESLIEKGCSAELERVLVKIGGNEISCGEEYPLSDVGGKTQPGFSFPEANESGLYVVTMIDPDAPSKAKPVKRSWLHFMAINVKGKELRSGNIPSASIVTEYNPPTPPKGSGLHRYITLVLKQLRPLQGISFKERGSFNIDTFAGENSLELEGSNMFKTERI